MPKASAPPQAFYDRVTVVLVIAALALAPLFVVRNASGTMLPKATLIVSIALMCLALWVAKSVMTRQVVLPWGLAAGAAVLLTAALGVAAALAPVPVSAWLGPEMRVSGLASYLACLTLFFATLTVFGKEDVETAAKWSLAAVLLSALAGLLQALPLSVWIFGASQPIRALLGNTNFSSALLGMGVPLLLWVALRRDQATWVRALFIALAIGVFSLAVASRSIQGPIVALGGSGVLLAAWVLEHVRRPVRALSGLGVLAASAGTLLVYGLATGAGPLGWAAGSASVGPRLWYWEAAMNMFSASPLTGVGFGMYPSMYTVHRSVESVQDLPTGIVADDAHSLPLNMLAEGGALLGLAYGLFLVTIGIALVTALRRLEGDDRLLAGAIGGAWIAYQGQSLISIDVPGLMPWNYIFAALLVILSRSTSRKVIQVGAPTGKSGGLERSRKQQRRLRYALVAAALVALPAVSLAFQPVRADILAQQGLAALDNQDFERAVALLEDAHTTFPAQASHLSALGAAVGNSGRPEDGVAMMVEATRLDPYDRDALSNAATNAATVGDSTTAAQLWERLLQLDRFNVVHLTRAAAFAREEGELAHAEDLLQRALAIDPVYEQAQEELEAVLADQEATG